MFDSPTTNALSMENLPVKASFACRGPGRLAALLLAAALLAPMTAAQNAPGPPANTLYPLPDVEGAVPWEWLAGVQMVFEGIDLVPDYRPELRALDGEQVTLVGFLMPLSADGKRQLLSMISPNCPFCLPGGPATFVELLADRAIDWTDDAVVVGGRLELLEDDWSGYYYRLHDARRLAGPAA